MANQIFDTFTREDDRSLSDVDSLFDFFNRCSWPMIENVRCLFEEYLNRYPTVEKHEIITRLRSNDDTLFNSASFELLLHEVLLRNGCTLTPHPQLPNGSPKKPDFLVQTPEGEEFYLEARLIKDLRETSQEALNRKNEVLDYLNQKPHKNYRIWLDEDGEPNGQPSSRKIKNKIHEWLDNLDADEILRVFQTTIEELPILEFNVDGWNFKIRPIPLEKKKRGSARTFIGSKGTGLFKLGVTEALREGIKKKSSRYGDLDKPYIIAINAIDVPRIGKFDEECALFGSEKIVLEETENGFEQYNERADDGVFYLKYKPSHTRVSGVWIFRKFTFTDIVKSEYNLYFHPYAKDPLPKSLEIYPHVKVSSANKIIRNSGVAIQEILAVSDSWPDDG